MSETYQAATHIVTHHELAISLSEEDGYAESPEELLSALESVAERIYLRNPSVATSLREFIDQYVEDRLKYFM